ncbi:hypothetical protein VPNG_04065 [Cytospora leucostoma]|uniref:Uncharacterized protein n=1 Tax=Cytospora leucostoma TaxID=1230097 RepID=A0A423XDF2_9PEZI|nr:hypothetical protein VPNG_04065 [Cytospora leucostoma]
MVGGRKRFEAFLDDVPDEKLEYLPEDEQTLHLDHARGYRLDHQGLNQDQNEGDWIYRLYVQPIGSAKSKSKSQRRKSLKNTKIVLAQCHTTGGEAASEIRAALLESYINHTSLVYAPKKHYICNSADMLVGYQT